MARRDKPESVDGRSLVIGVGTAKMPPELGQYRLLTSKTSLVRKAFPVQSSHTFAVGSAVFDEPNLVSAAGLVPIMELAEQTGLSRLIGEHVDPPSTRVASGAVNPAGKLTTIIAGMMCGADSIDDVNVLRARRSHPRRRR